MHAAVLPSSLLPMGSYTPGPPYMDNPIMLSYIVHCTCDNEAEEHTFLYVEVAEHTICTLNTPFPFLPG